MSNYEDYIDYSKTAESAPPRQVDPLPDDPGTAGFMARLQEHRRNNPPAMLEDYTTFDEAVKAAQDYGLTIESYHYLTESIVGGIAYYNTSILTGAYLNPRGLIQKTHSGWTLLFYKEQL